MEIQKFLLYKSAKYTIAANVDLFVLLDSEIYRFDKRKLSFEKSKVKRLNLYSETTPSIILDRYFKQVSTNLRSKYLSARISRDDSSKFIQDIENLSEYIKILKLKQLQ